MQIVTRPKLLPPLALLWQGPRPGPAPLASAAPALRFPLSGLELRNIVAERIG
jgi:hypothetical protein